MRKEVVMVGQDVAAPEISRRVFNHREQREVDAAVKQAVKDITAAVRARRRIETAKLTNHA